MHLSTVGQLADDSGRRAGRCRLKRAHGARQRASKFHRNLDKEVYVNGSNKPADVAEAFASHFSSVYTNSDDATSAKSEFDGICIVEGLHRMSSVVMTYLGLLMLNLSTSVLEN